MNKFMIFNFLICILILSACSNQEKKWEKAKEKNTVSAFNKFIKQYPESQRIPEAKGLLSRLIISELNNTFGIKTDITDEQVKTYMEHFDQETFSTTVNSPVKYYKVSGNSCSGYLSKEKDIILPKEIGKACSLQLEIGDLLITAFYSSNPSIKHPLFVDKRYPKMTHNGCSGPGLELRSTSKTEIFLKTFLI